MKRYNVNDFTGTAEEVIRHLHKSSRAPAKDDQTWMEETSRRAALAFNVKLRYDTPDHFMEDATSTGCLESLTEN